MRLTLYLRKKIDGYNNGVQYSIKKIQNERNSYFEEYLSKPNDSYNSKTNQRLTRMDIIFRLSHSTEKKYIELYNSLKFHIINFDLFANKEHKDNIGSKSSKIDETQVRKSVKEVYELYHALNTESDDLEIDFKHNLIKAFPSQKIDPSPQKIYDLFRIIESIDEQREKILKTPIQIQDEIFSEYSALEDSEPSFPTITEPIKFDFHQDEYPSSDEEFEKSPPKKKKEKTVDYSNLEKDVEFMNRIEIEKNYFKEFYEKFKKFIFKKEFWGLFLNDLLNDLKSDKTNEELFSLFESSQYFGDPEPAFELINHRENIIKFSNFMSAEEERKQSETKKKGQDNDNTNRPTNFGVKVNNKTYYSNEYAAYDESNLGKTNYEVLALLVKFKNIYNSFHF